MSEPAAPPRAQLPVLPALDLVLVTGRLRLRPFRGADLDALWPLVSDPAVSRLMSWTAHTDRSQTESFLRHAQDSLAASTGVAWAIEREDRVIGCISLEDIQFVQRAWRVDRAELGYWIAPALWGQGLVTEAGQAVLRCGFATIGLHKISASCFAENVGSRRVLEKLGFRLVGRLEDDVWRDGRWWSGLRYELTAADAARPPGHAPDQ
jgi:RimJ/RimL family protein N-acetyltransferase